MDVMGLYDRELEMADARATLREVIQAERRCRQALAEIKGLLRMCRLDDAAHTKTLLGEVYDLADGALKGDEAPCCDPDACDLAG